MLSIGKKEIIGGSVLALIGIFLLVILINVNSKEVYYQVIFDSMGGTEVAGQNILVGGQLKQPSETIKEGYTFKGWYFNDKKFDFSTKIYKDIILIAKWEEINDEKKVIEEQQKVEEITDVKEEKKEEKKENNSVENRQTKPIEQKANTPIIVEVTSITLSVGTLSLKVGDSSTIKATVLPTNATNSNVEWKSSNNGVVMVSNGNIVAVGAGTAIITAESGGKTASCIVSVVKPVTYTYEIIDTPASSIGQCDIYIRNSDGVRVSGTITIHYTNGKDETVDVTSNGVRRIRSAISSVTIESING